MRFALPVLVFPCVEHMFATDTMMSPRHIQQGIYACLGHMLGEICKSFLKVQEDSRRFRKDQEDSRRFNNLKIKAPGDSRMFKKIQEGSNRFKNIQENSMMKLTADTFDK